MTQVTTTGNELRRDPRLTRHASLHQAQRPDGDLHKDH
jgi:hypothetical protein